MLRAGLRWCYGLLTPTQRRLYWIVTLLAAFAAVMELVGVAAVIPVVSSLVEPGPHGRIRYIAWMTPLLGGADGELSPLTLTVTGAAVVWASAGITLLSLLTSRRFLRDLNSDLAARVYHWSMSQPIERFYSQPASEFARTVNGVSERIALGVVGASVVLLARSFLLIVVLSVLIFVDSLLTLILVALVFGSYLVIYLSVKPTLTRLTLRSFKEGRLIHQLVIGSYNTYRSITVDRRLPEFVDRFRQLKRSAARLAADVEIMGSIPRQGIEVVGISALLLAAYFVGKRSHDTQHFVTVLALFGVAAYRILPAAQQVYLAVSRITASLAVCAEFRPLWGNLKPAPETASSREMIASRPRVLELDRVSYRYGAAPLLSHFNARIELTGIVRIAGSSGAGKSTLLEILAGLRTPNSGRVLLDGRPLASLDLRQWWSRVSYLSQADYVFEGSIRENVIGGSPADEERFALVSSICGLERLTNDRANAEVAEGGVDISGGQRGRILLARALYKRSDVLLLDEAFASLDVTAARGILDRLCTAMPDRCIVIVSHREEELPRGIVTVELALAGRTVGR
jgi:ABC-type bacteriocin/lantibiotic exporter with double-glycine peptidase domain